MVTKRDDDRRPTTNRVNIEQSASGRWTGRVLQYQDLWNCVRCLFIVKRVREQLEQQ